MVWREWVTKLILSKLTIKESQGSFFVPNVVIKIKVKEIYLIAFLYVTSIFDFGLQTSENNPSRQPLAQPIRCD